MAKKNPVQSALFLGLIAIVLVAVSYFVVRPHQEQREKEKERSALLYPDLQREKILEFSFENAQGSFHLKRRADQKEEWMVENTKTFNADKSSIDGVVSTLLSAKKENSVAGQDLVALGLQPAKFKLKIGEGTEAAKRELWLGEDTPVDYLVYAKWSDSPEVFLTSRSLRFSLDKKLAELRDKKVTALAPEKIAQIEIMTTAHAAAGLSAQKLKFEKLEGGNWQAANAVLAGKNVNLDKAEIDKFLSALKDLAVTGFASEDPAQRVKEFGFAHPIATLSLAEKEAKNGKEAVVWQLAMVDDKKAKTKKYYLARPDKDSTYEVAETFVDNFKVDLFKFRPKTLITTAKTAVTDFSINDGTNSIEFKKNGTTAWTYKATTPKGETSGQAKADVVDKSLDALTSLKALEFHDTMTPYTAGLQRPSRIVELRGAKDGKEESLQTLFFGRKTGDRKWVMRTTSMDAPASVSIDLESALPAKADAWALPPPAVSPPATGVLPEAMAATPVAKRKKMEATVKNLHDIKKLPAPIVKAGKRYTAEITFSKGGKIVLNLASDKAPYTVSNFLNLARNHFYDGTKFHRVIKDFMAQGGDPTGTGTGGPGYKFDNEDNDLKHKRGAISMAHAGRNTNGSQFFICFKEQPHLDGLHTVFGEVSQGLDVLDGIQQGDIMKSVEVFEE